MISTAPLMKLLGSSYPYEVTETVSIKRIILRHTKKRVLIFLGNLSVEAVDLNMKQFEFFSI